MHHYSKYTDLVADNAYAYASFTNSQGDEVVLMEHPKYGEEVPVLVAFPKQDKAFCSDFHDTFELEDGGEYEPCLVEGELKMKWELE